MKQVRPKKLTRKEQKELKEAKAMMASIATENFVPWGSDCNTCDPLKYKSDEDLSDEQLELLAKVLDTLFKSNPDIMYDDPDDEGEYNDDDTNCMDLDCEEEVGESFQMPVPTVPLHPARQINLANVQRADVSMQIIIASPEFCELPTYRAQVHYLRFNKQSLRRIADVFDVTVGAIQHQLRLPLESRANGRPRILMTSIRSALYQHVKAELKKGPITTHDVLDYLKTEQSAICSTQTVRNMLIEFGLKSVTAKPIESARLQCSDDAIQHHFVDLRRYCENVPAELVGNTDEIGFSEYADCHELSVWVPNETTGDVYYPIERTQRRVTLLSVIFTDGLRYPHPLLVVPRKTVDVSLFRTGYTANNCRFHSSDNGFITTAIFSHYMVHDVLPFMESRRRSIGYNGDSVLILDGCSCHDGDAFLNACTRYNVISYTLPAHSSEQTQPCDVGVFGLHKREMSQIRVAGDLTAQANQLSRILKCYERAGTTANIVSSFRQAGIVPVWNTIRERLVVHIDPAFARRLRSPCKFVAAALEDGRTVDQTDGRFPCDAIMYFDDPLFSEDFDSIE